MNPSRALRPLRRTLRPARKKLEAFVASHRKIRDYLMLLDRIHALLRPRTYFEIGVAQATPDPCPRP
jgi:hypothetical protein